MFAIRASGTLLPARLLRPKTIWRPFLYETAFSTKPLLDQLPSCWDILGVPQNSSVREIKVAFRQRARSAHPDKARSTYGKEKATRRFQRVYSAYEKALTLARSPSPSTTGRSWSQGRSKSPTWSDVERAFRAVCLELEAESEIRLQTAKSTAIEKTAAYWPSNPEECFRSSRPFTHEVIAHFSMTNRNLANFLRYRLGANMASSRISNHSSYKKAAEKLSMEWSSDNSALEKWMSENFRTQEYEEIALCLCESMAGTLQEWKHSRCLDRQRLRDERLERAACTIRQEYPNHSAISGILRPFPKSDRALILQKLPVNMQTCLIMMTGDEANNHYSLNE